MVRGLLLGELEPVRRRDHHDALVRADDLALDELAEGGERDAGVRAVEHAGAVGARRLVGELLLAGLLDDAVELLQRPDGALELTGLPIWIALASVFSACTGSKCSKFVEVRPVERIGVLGLGDGDARQLLDQAELAASSGSPCRARCTLPRLPPGITTQSGTSQSNCWTISMATVFWPSMRRLFIELAR